MSRDWLSANHTALTKLHGDDVVEQLKAISDLEVNNQSELVI